MNNYSRLIEEILGPIHNSMTIIKNKLQKMAGLDVGDNAKLKELAESLDSIPIFSYMDVSVNPGETLEINSGYFSGGKITCVPDDRVKGVIERTSVNLIDETAEKIGDYAFYKYTTLKEATLLNITDIGTYAFSECTSLETVDLGEKLVKLGSAAFMKSSKLNNIVLPEGTITIGGSCFQDCSSLENISLPNSIKTFGGYCFIGTKIKLSALPEDLETVGDVACYNRPGVTFTHIPRSVKTIGNRGFDACTGLTEIIFDGAPESIGANAFRGCTKLHTVTFNAPLGDKTLTMDASTFTGCANLKTINCNWPQGTVYNAPWGAPNVETINYNPPVPEVEITPPEGGWPDE